MSRVLKPLAEHCRFLGLFNLGKLDLFDLGQTTNRKNPLMSVTQSPKGQHKIRSAISPTAHNSSLLLEGARFVDRGCGTEVFTCTGNGGKGNTPVSFRLWLLALSFFTCSPPSQKVDDF